jgi:hypothetical protein
LEERNELMSDQRPSTVAEIRQMADAAVVMSFVGTVVKRFARKSGTNSQGEWSIENIEVKDAAGEVIKVKIKDCDPLDAAFVAGARIQIAATKSDKHGWIGVKAKDDDYKDKITRILWVTSSALVQTAPPDGNAQPATGGDTRRPEPSATGDPVADTEAHLCRTANLQRMTIRKAFALAREWENAPQAFKTKYGEEMPLEFLQSVNASLFIEACRNSAYGQLPTEPIKPKTK